jgi:putative transposon-encoded protein
VGVCGLFSYRKKPFSTQKLLYRRNQYILSTYINHHPAMVRRMRAIIAQIESVVTPSGNSGHVVVPKAWIGQEAIVKLKGAENKGRKKRHSTQ